MGVVQTTCECGKTVDGPDLESFADAFLAHTRAEHPDWAQFPDMAVRNYAQATQRLTGPSERLDAIGEIEIHPVTPERLDDWLGFFDHDAFVGKPEWAACYCSEPHVMKRGTPPEDEPHLSWQERRETTIGLLQAGRSFGYLAYVDGHPAAWVNASKRSEYALYRLEGAADPADGDVIGISCFIVAPPYRRHGLAARLLQRVIADAPGRGVSWIEAYPFNEDRGTDAGNFRGPRSLFDDNGFEPVEVEARQTVVRRAA
jgi:GNAT superfamily N-acetyltransferase